MRCPFCGNTDVKVTDSRMAPELNAIRRRRECLQCNRRFTTFETVELNIQVRKRDGIYEDFDEQKLIRGMESACRHTHISKEQVRAIALKISVQLMEKGVRIRAIGRLHELPEAVRKDLAKTIEMSADNTGLTVRLALSYGGRSEVIDAVRRIAVAAREGSLSPEEIDEELFREYLYDPEMTDPDLLIRTGGEMRISNFLLWHLSYAELWVTPICWPDFRRPQFEEALEEMVGVPIDVISVGPEREQLIGRKGWNYSSSGAHQSHQP